MTPHHDRLRSAGLTRCRMLARRPLPCLEKNLKSLKVDDTRMREREIFGGEIKYTKRYRLSQLLSTLTHHFLLLGPLRTMGRKRTPALHGVARRPTLGRQPPQARSTFWLSATSSLRFHRRYRMSWVLYRCTGLNPAIEIQRCVNVPMLRSQASVVASPSRDIPFQKSISAAL